ncbi:sigma-70 family RNA polymerase sigma factor [Rhodovarius crocodyli]|uniref:Sigma-70 family RNA polymerase sigma factor n=1 Tax=Rhodovarius crocodyli TaxID=1979269 RepID=A0A437MMZ9_9PROT|nr:sigma-70 family RNA polymerase sigma factor [Rhodovarius crocodyli]RVT99021.1 sigma-70 family RNA polymerase sigma factor [Rhodovarius crocodyli]
MTSALRQQLPEHLDAAYNLARWLVRDPAAAEDVMQDAVERALRYAASWRGENLRAWLLRIVRTQAYAWLAARRDPTEQPFEDGLAVTDPAPDPEAVLVSRQQHRDLEAALAALPAELREALVLRELEELSYREIAEVAGIPVGTVMSRLWRARRALIERGARG